MITTLLGLILLLMPFLLIYKFEDKKVGFAYILSFMIFFHLVVAVATQALGIFNYSVIFGINAVVALIILAKSNFKQFFGNLKGIKLIKIDWILVFVIIVIFIQLYSVHYNYTGTVTSINEPYKEVTGMKYPYPYFSDEWSAVSFIKYSIRTGNLPLANPFWYDKFFPNLELPFHSFISEIILLLDLNPLTQYTILTIFTGMLICLLIYFILRINGISRIISGITSLSALYIVNGSNLPGIWNLIPIIMGIISMLLCFLFMSLNKRKMVLFSTFLALIFYPPLFIFYTASLILYFIFADISKKEKIKYTLLYFFICLLGALLISIFTYLDMGFHLRSFVFSYLKGKVFYPSITKDAIPDFTIWKIIPIPIILLSVFGIFKETKKNIWLVAPVFVGLLFWWIYSFVLWRFIIEDARVVVFTSILIVILSGFGLHYLAEYLKKFDFIRKYRVIEISQIIIMIGFFVLAFSYTQRDNWQELKLRSVVDDKVISPAAPANMYLNEDDLKLFNGINGKNFLSPPWKGLVIGTATSNYPLITKESTLTNKITDFNSFMNSNCSRKYEIAKQKNINYVYSQEFECNGFEIKGISGEGLHLYEVVIKS